LLALKHVEACQLQRQERCQRVDGFGEELFLRAELQHCVEQLEKALPQSKSVLLTALQRAELCDIAEDQNSTVEASSCVGDRGTAIINGELFARAAAKDRVVCQSHNSPLAEHASDGIFDRLAGFFVEDDKDFLQRSVTSFGKTPSGQLLGSGIEELHPSFGIGHDNRIADAVQHVPEPLRVGAQRAEVFRATLGGSESYPELGFSERLYQYPCWGNALR
jgi:hypothetical protein